MKRLTLLAVGFLLIGCGLDLPAIFVDPVQEACGESSTPDINTIRIGIRAIRDEGISKLEMLAFFVTRGDLCVQGFEEMIGRSLSSTETWEVRNFCTTCMTAIIDEVYNEP